MPGLEKHASGGVSDRLAPRRNPAQQFRGHLCVRRVGSLDSVHHAANHYVFRSVLRCVSIFWKTKGVADPANAVKIPGAPTYRLHRLTSSGTTPPGHGTDKPITMVEKWGRITFANNTTWLLAVWSAPTPQGPNAMKALPVLALILATGVAHAQSSISCYSVGKNTYCTAIYKNGRTVHCHCVGNHAYTNCK